MSTIDTIVREEVERLNTMLAQARKSNRTVVQVLNLLPLWHCEDDLHGKDRNF